MEHAKCGDNVSNNIGPLRRSLNNDSNRYSPYGTRNDPHSSKTIDGTKNESLLKNLTNCFSDTIENIESNPISEFDSEDIFSDNLNFADEISIQNRTLLGCDKSITLNPLNASYANLNESHFKNLEKSVLNEDSKVKDLSQIAKTSQYKKEILNAFDECDATICHLNENIFDDIENNQNQRNVSSKTILGDNSIWDKWDDTGRDDSNSDFKLPNNFTQLMMSKIDSKSELSIEKESQEKTSQVPVLKTRTPFSQKEQMGDFYGLPDLAKSLIFQYKGIQHLYDWQNECLLLPAVKDRKNLIYALPTSGGKTLVAEILMLREIVCRKKSVMFILPFVSIVQEKVWGLSPFAVGLDFLVEEYAAGKGIFPPRKRRNRKSIYVATLEKGLCLLRSFLELKRLNEIGLIVVDELHLLGEASRGCILELLLTNAMYSGEDIQIVGMSATIGNLAELAKFLNADIYTQDFRPVELKEYMKVGENIYKILWQNGEDERVVLDRKINFGYSPQIEKLDPDHLGGLVMEVIPNGSCLIFCPTKKNCENVAVLLCKVIFKTLLEYKSKEKKDLVIAMRAEGGSDESLLSLLPWGIAYHHSGLATEERRLLEDAFRAGVISVLCCTSTLAAGVNLPAQRVILRAPLVGKQFVTLSTYKQMVGRAGRAGFGGHGDSILICPQNKMESVRELINSPMDKVSSNLHSNDSICMRSLVLSAIALEIANTRRTLRTLTNHSLLFVQAERLEVDVKSLLDKTIETLFKMGAINVKQAEEAKGPALDISDNISATPHTRNSLEKNSTKTKDVVNKHIKVTNDTELVISRLGKASVKGAIELQRAHMLYADLKVAQNSLVVIDILHLLYLVTPYDVSESIKPNLNNYYTIYSNLNDDSLQTAKVIGFTEAVAIQLAKGKIPKSVSERVLNRFYVTLILYDLWNQHSLPSVSQKFQVNKGMIQSLMLASATFGSSVLRFCEELEEFWAFRDLLKNVSHRLSHFCTLELLPLMELPSVRKGRAMQLYKSGFKTIKDVAKAKPIDLIESLEHVTKNVANQLIAAAKLLLLEKVENLREEAEDVIEGLNQ